jgi:Golgi phosphoprotein 3
MRRKRARGSASEKASIMQQLTLADEIVVLMLRDDTGAIKPACSGYANIAIAGGVLMELALQGRIDTDLTSLYIVDPKPTGDELLDQALKEISAASDHRPTTWWIERFGLRGDDLTRTVLRRLVEAGILREEDRQFLWMFSRRAYPQNTGREQREAKARLLSMIFNDAVPDPRDTLLLGLAHSSGVLNELLSPDELRKASNRIARVVALEEIGRSVGAVESSLRATLAAVATARFG